MEDPEYYFCTPLVVRLAYLHKRWINDLRFQCAGLDAAGTTMVSDPIFGSNNID